ncbi:phosphopantetheine-binding protein [Flavobacterium tegetincola]|uniref:phosphopantetheine-binding protein n=1 Tax=Flavobacterium tegetincola TaxID=150172 RepID=UPI00041C262F|nr:phosphopantetheine-binding protein [Flavobacterium tegetincola]
MNRIEQLTEIVRPYVPNLELLKTVTLDTDFIRDLSINSADLVDIILDIEEKFDIIIDDEGMQKMLNVKAAIAIIEEELAKK